MPRRLHILVTTSLAFVSFPSPLCLLGSCFQPVVSGYSTIAGYDCSRTISGAFTRQPQRNGDFLGEPDHFPYDLWQGFVGHSRRGAGDTQCRHDHVGVISHRRSNTAQTLFKLLVVDRVTSLANT